MAVSCGDLPLSPCGRGWRDANVVSVAPGEGFSQHCDMPAETPHPTVFASTGGDALSHKGRGRCDGQRNALPEFSGRDWLLLPLSPCGRGWRDANAVSVATGEGLFQHRDMRADTPHPTAFASTGGDALSHKGRGRCDWQRNALFGFSGRDCLPHSAASARASRPRSTTRRVVRMRCVVPSWKRITVSTGMSRLPP